MTETAAPYATAIPEYGPYVVIRADRPAIPAHHADLVSAREFASKCTVANGGEYLVLRTVGRVYPIAGWEPALIEGGLDDAAALKAQAWNAYP